MINFIESENTVSIKTGMVFSDFIFLQIQLNKGKKFRFNDKYQHKTIWKQKNIYGRRYEKNEIYLPGGN